MSDNDGVPEVRPLPWPGQATRMALIRTYRHGLRTSPARAWEDTLALARERFPAVEVPALRKMLLLQLGLFALDAGERRDPDAPPNTEGYMPCLMCPAVTLRLYSAARHFGVSVDELVCRVTDAWLTAACDFDGVPEDGMALPPPPTLRS